jgi:hypothetical protein
VILGADYKRQASFFKAFSFAAFRQCKLALWRAYCGAQVNAIQNIYDLLK